MNGIETITVRIIDEAKAYREAALKEGRADAEKLKKSYEAKAEQIKAKYAADAKKECDAVLQRARSSAELIKRNMLLDTKSRMIDTAFETAKKEILEMPEKEYAAFILKLLADAAEALPVKGEAELVMNSRDRERYGEMIRRGFSELVDNKRTVTLSKETADIDGGVIVKCGDIEINCSLSLLVDQIRGELESKVLSVLF